MLWKGGLAVPFQCLVEHTEPMLTPLCPSSPAQA